MPLLDDGVNRRPTPAFAGSTLPRPRTDASTAGLPPPSRGAPGGRGGRPRGHRPTPAFAGSTRDAAVSVRQRLAYPRLRGEHLTPYVLLWSVLGLPPPSRGAPSGTGKTLLMVGPTPAFAGST